MTRWECAISGCGETFDTAEALLIHQNDAHEDVECAVCGDRFPEGYFAIRHVFTEHTRAQYVRAYDASSDDIRQRESILEDVSDEIDLQKLRETIDGRDGHPTGVSAGD